MDKEKHKDPNLAAYKLASYILQRSSLVMTVINHYSTDHQIHYIVLIQKACDSSYLQLLPELKDPDSVAHLVQLCKIAF